MQPSPPESKEARSGYESDTSSEESLHSDNLDEEFHSASLGKRRRLPGPSTHTKRGKVASLEKQGTKRRTREKKKRKTQEGSEEEVSDIDLKDGQEVVGKVVQAPKTGWAAKGHISQHTLDFLKQLRDPACNDRAWFKLHEPVYRRCEAEFREFIRAFSEMLVGVDPQIPPLPPKDVVHRIYRDIRFSNDKTPYKTGLSASFSRSGRKGIFAFYHVYVFLPNRQYYVFIWVQLAKKNQINIVKPGDESVIAAGAWCPGKNELSSIRNHILHSSDRLREIISHPDFVANFGEPRPHPKGKRQSVFGHEDELKTAPKGVSKSHADIDLLKCRSLAVSRTFKDEQVLGSDFTEELEKVVRVLRPFVHCLNDMVTLPVGNGSTDES